MSEADSIRGRLRRTWIVGMVYGVATLLLWPVPLLNVLHVESSALIAGVAFFVSGYSALAAFGRRETYLQVIAVQMFWLLVPWVLLTLTLLWIPNCGYGLGLLFYLMFPPVSVALAVSIAYLLTGLDIRRRRWTFAGIGFGLMILTPLYDLGLHPQFYVYNHVFGGILGPVYDEELAVRSGLFVFRGLTLLWAALFFVLGRRHRLVRAARREHSFAIVPRSNRVTIGGLTLMITLVYIFSGPLGINTPDWFLQTELAGHIQTEHFDIYYKQKSVSENRIRLLAEEHEFRYEQLSRKLGVEVQERIQSYLYPDAETKARLTGARTTSVAPVWLADPQSHVLLERFADSFTHELAHVFSRSFGMPLLHASVSVGLVEGFAVAVEPPGGLPAPHRQVATAVAYADSLGFARDSTLARAIADRLSPLGFWTGRSSVSYTTMGSFVSFLLERYGMEPFTQAYPWMQFESAYGKSSEALAEEWRQYIRQQPVSVRTRQVVQARFTQPSLFEQRCPHYVPNHVRLYRKAQDALAGRDTSLAFEYLERSLADYPNGTLAMDLWGRLKLAQGKAAEFVEYIEPRTPEDSARAVTMGPLLGDAYVIQGQPDQARFWYNLYQNQVSFYARNTRALMQIRRALAEQAPLIRMLYRADPPEARAHIIQSLSRDAYGRVLAALLYAEAEAYPEAVALLEDVAFNEPRLSQRTLVWLALFSYYKGAVDDAVHYATTARMVAQYDDPEEAAQLGDFLDQLQWVRAHRLNGE